MNRPNKIENVRSTSHVFSNYFSDTDPNKRSRVYRVAFYHLLDITTDVFDTIAENERVLSVARLLQFTIDVMTIMTEDQGLSHQDQEHQVQGNELDMLTKRLLNKVAKDAVRLVIDCNLLF